MSTFGERLKEAMDYSGITQDALAEAVGISQQTIQYSLAKGKGSTHVNKISKILGVRIDWLADDEGEMLASTVDEAPAKYDVSLSDDPELQEALTRLKGLEGKERQAAIDMLLVFSSVKNGK